MGEPQESFLAKARPVSVDVELDWLVAQLADEAEYWKQRAQLFERAVDELLVEVYALRLESKTSQPRTPRSAHRRMALVEEKPGVQPKAAISRRSQLLLSACALLSFLAYAAYRLVAG